jgi:aminoglycoside phosphotransferase (APT) family kinase protein
MDNIVAIANYLEASGQYPLRIAKPLPAPDGRVFWADTSGFWRIFPFFEHTKAPEKQPSAEQAFEAARAYGIFLNALRDFPARQLSETIPGFHDTDRRWAVFEAVLHDDPAGRVANARPEIEAMYAAKPVFDQISALKRDSLPLRVTHNDTKAGNVLLDVSTDRAVSVIDWDTVMPGVVLSDFGDMVRTFASNSYEDDPHEAVAIRKPVLEALSEGFLSETAALLTPIERTNLMLGGQWIVGEQALRFLADYLAGDPYYKIAYPTHNLVRAKNQLALFDRLFV